MNSLSAIVSENFSLNANVSSSQSMVHKRNRVSTAIIIFIIAMASSFCMADQDPITVNGIATTFGQKPIPIAVEGFSGEAAEVLKFDLYVQGYTFVSPGTAQYVIQGSDEGNVTGSLT